eukprot:4892500-Amphidinium_carterae.1
MRPLALYCFRQGALVPSGGRGEIKKAVSSVKSSCVHIALAHHATLFHEAARMPLVLQQLQARRA